MSNSWHPPLPRDGAWKAVTLAYAAERGGLLWLRCDGCGRNVDEAPAALAGRAGLDMGTPLALIARRLVCRVCGARKGHCWPPAYAAPDRRLGKRFC